MAKYRVDRVAVEVQREVNQILRDTVHDPRVSAVNITDVQLTGDLSQAVIYYSILSGLASAAEAAQAGLDAARGLIRRELAHRMSIYKVPELAFKRDDSVAYGSKIDELLRGLRED